jgi:hypothetical protein
MKTSCGCCAVGGGTMSPATANRPRLSAIAYRVGIQPTFLATMKARLSNLALEIPALDEFGQAAPITIYPIQNLKTRDASDPAIALLDAWATMADILTFYQERIANEGYLRTAIERRSILELARLIGYKLRPGVASSVYLAYTMDDQSEASKIPAGTRAQSVPGPGELPQSFETSEPLPARREWNNLKPRLTRPQIINHDNAEFVEVIYFAGTATNLKPNDPLLFAFDNLNGETVRPILRKIKSVEPLFAENMTKVTLQLSLSVEAFKRAVIDLVNRFSSFDGFCVAADELPDEAVTQLSFLRTLSESQEKSSKKLQGQVSEILQLLLRIQAGSLERPGIASVYRWISKLIESLEAYGRALQAEEVPSRNPFDALKRAKISSRPAFESLVNLARPLSLPVSQHPANSLLLGRNIQTAFDTQHDTVPQLLTVFNEKIGATAYKAWENAVVTAPAPATIYGMRVTASLFGNTAPRKVKNLNRETGEITETGEWRIIGADVGDVQINEGSLRRENADHIDLDGSHEKILPQSWVVVDTTDVDKSDKSSFTDRKIPNIVISRAERVSATISRGDYGFSGKITRIRLDDPWFEFKREAHVADDVDFQLIRHTVVHAQSEQLALADAPIEDDVCGGKIELGQLYDGLKSGRWLIVTGERTDLFRTSGVKASELVMLADVEQAFDSNLPGDRVHSTLILSNKLAYTYKRDTVTIYGNVVKATHGETRPEVLGGGDASKAMQQFMLKQPPLTYVSAATPDGIASTLQVRVNDVEWHETDSLAGLAPQDRKFITMTDDDGKTAIIFGNGTKGARLPTGAENIKAYYRNGIGKAGNVKAEQISLLTMRPLGVKAVINPIRASGGVDKERRDQARRNAPLAVMSLDRLVSTQDYADFACTFAGIGKASAVRLSDGKRQLVHVTIAGVDDVPIDDNSDLYRNLRLALHQFGDPYQAVQVAQRELLALAISARVRVLPDYQWESVEPEIRAALLEKFSFENRELGQSVFLSEVISTVQQTRGVAYVDVDFLDVISEGEVMTPTELEKKFAGGGIDVPKFTQPRSHIPVNLALPAGQDDATTNSTPRKTIQPARLAILLSGVPATLNLNPIEESNR